MTGVWFKVSSLSANSNIYLHYLQVNEGLNAGCNLDKETSNKDQNIPSAEGATSNVPSDLISALPELISALKATQAEQVVLFEKQEASLKASEKLHENMKLLFEESQIKMATTLSEFDAYRQNLSDEISTKLSSVESKY